MGVMTTARREYEALVLQRRIRHAKNTASLNEEVVKLTPGDELLVCREKSGWNGPYIFLHRDGRLPVALDDERRVDLFHSTMLISYKRPNMEIKDILNPNDDLISSILDTHLVEMIHNEQDTRFTDSKQQELDGIVAKWGVK